MRQLSEEQMIIAWPHFGGPGPVDREWCRDESRVCFEYACGHLGIEKVTLADLATARRSDPTALETECIRQHYGKSLRAGHKITLLGAHWTVVRVPVDPSNQDEQFRKTTRFTPGAEEWVLTPAERLAIQDDQPEGFASGEVVENHDRYLAQFSIAPKDQEHGSSPNRANIPTFTISLNDRGIGEFLDTQGILRTELTKLGLFGEEFLYCSAPPNKIDLVSETGSYRSDAAVDGDTIFACYVQRRSDSGELVISDVADCVADIIAYLVQHATGSDDAFMVVYLRSHFEEGDLGVESYRFSDPAAKLAAIAALIRIEDFWQLRSKP